MSLSGEILEAIVPDALSKSDTSPLDVVIHCLGQLMHARDPITYQHSKRVGILTGLIAQAVGIDEHASARLASASVLHDIGKAVLPLEIISKPTSLTREEWVLVKSHPVIGHTVLADSGDPLMDIAAELALQHHEHFDGTGYPYGLSGEEISLPSRILGICDVYDALRRDRPYRKGVSHDEALNIITVGDGRTSPKHFDPQVLRAFILHSRHIKDAFEHAKSLDNPFV